MYRKLAAIGCTLILAGCGAVVPRTGAPGPKAPPPAVRPDQPRGALPQDQERNRVALLVPMTGPNAAVGQSIANAANLALIDSGATRVRITTYDTATGAAAAAQRALGEGNRLFLGPLLADDVRAVAPAARAADVPVVAFSNDATVAGNGVFLMGFSPVQSIYRVVDYAKSKGASRFAGLMPAGAYGRNASNALIKAASASGGSVASLQAYDRSAKSLNGAILKLGKDYDAVLIADGGRIAVQAAPLIRKTAGPGVRILGTELWNTEPSISTAPAMNGAVFASVPDAIYRQFATKYRVRFAKGPYRLASLGYDAVLLTVRIAQDWRAGDDFPKNKLFDKGGFSGVDGAFRFGSDGVAQRMLAVHQVGPGGFTVVSPAARGFGE